MNLDDFNPSYPVEFRSIESLVLVCKAARVARLIPSTRVVEVSSRVNFYWYAERLNPLWYYERIRKKQQEVQKRKMMEPSKGTGLMKRASWGGLEIAALAKVKAMADERRKKEKQLGFISRHIERMKRGFRSVGFLPNTNLELKRHIAATQIQRAWRSRLIRPTDTRSADGMDAGSEHGDEGWRGRGSGTSTLDRVLKKRSYYRQNGRSIRSGNDGFEYGKSSPNGGKDGKRSDSQVGTAMAEVTGQWVASIILLGLVLTIIFNYHERDATRPSVMMVLHGQSVRSPSTLIAEKALNVSRLSAIPSLYEYKAESESLGTLAFTFDPGFKLDTLRDREKLRIIVEDSLGRTEGLFENRQEIEDQALVELLMTIFVLVVWFLGVAAFAGPVMTVSTQLVAFAIMLFRFVD